MKSSYPATIDSKKAPLPNGNGRGTGRRLELSRDCKKTIWCTMTALTCFKAYDVRGRLGEELNADVARRIGIGFAKALSAKSVVVGRDCRESSIELQSALTDGLRAGGADVTDIGLCGTEEIYFATDYLGVDGGLMVTASHNPIDYNGIKMVQKGARPISSETGLADIKAAAEAEDGAPGPLVGTYETADTRDAFAAHVLAMTDPAAIKGLKVLANAGNGVAGPAFDAIIEQLTEQGAEIDIVRLHHEPDGSFPNGIPNPLLKANQPMTSDAVRAHGCDIGLAWDGDFDRCFFFDEKGGFIDGEYVVALLASAFLEQMPGEKIVYDPRVLMNTRAIVAAKGGQGVVSKTGHAFVKASMREADAVYGGEMSAHHYFRDFMYCDSGMIPWLLIVEYMCRTGQTLSSLVADMQANYPSSGEINFKLQDADAAATAVSDAFVSSAKAVDHLDGLSAEFEDWRFNLRKSNTEPLLRLNVETAGDRKLLQEKVDAISEIILSTGRPA